MKISKITFVLFIFLQSYVSQSQGFISIESSKVANMKRNYKLERLLEGETFLTVEKGNSMSPLIQSGQPHRVEPCGLEDAEIDDIVYCKVKGRFYTHLVKAKDPKKGVQIGNNKGGINGWTKAVYGKVIEIL